MGQMTPEQQKELEEKLAKMSPEELAEFQKQQCIFCQIIAGSIPSRIVYKDDTVMAVMDINPAAEGHLLVLPVEHYAVLPQMPEAAVAQLAKVIQRLSHLLIKVLGVEGTTVFAANGGAAGQRANHLMVHVIPRIIDDGLPLNVTLKEVGKSELEDMKNKLKKMFVGEVQAVSEKEQAPTEQAPSAEQSKEAAKEAPKESKSEQPVQQETKGKEEKEIKKPDLDAIAELLGK